jgi:hypothetical protein
MKQTNSAAKFDKLNEETGEIEGWVSLNFNPTVHKGFIVNADHKKPKKTKEHFIRITKSMKITNLTIQERGMLLFLSDLIEWENNFIQSEKGYMPIQDISDLSGLSKKTVLSILNNLQTKEFLTIVDLGNKKVVYLFSKFVWFGSENNRSDIKLQELLKEKALKVSIAQGEAKK